jgi:hypothetical protein
VVSWADLAISHYYHNVTLLQQQVQILGHYLPYLMLIEWQLGGIQNLNKFWSIHGCIVKLFHVDYWWNVVSQVYFHDDYI